MSFLKKLLASKLLKNFFRLMLSMIVTTLGSFFAFAVLGKKMSVEDYGIYSSMLALASMVAVFTNNVLAGIVANREIAVNPKGAKCIFSKFLTIRTILFLLAIVYIIFYAKSDPTITKITFIALVLMIAFDAFWELFEQVAFGLMVTKFSMHLNIAYTIAWCGFVFLIPFQIASVEVVLLGCGVLSVLKTAIYGFLIRHELNKSEQVDVPIPYKRLFLYSGPYLYNRVLGSVSTYIPILLLNGYSSLAQTAYYSVGEKFTTPIIKLTTAAISAVFPFITRELMQNRERASRLIVHVISIILCIGACLSIIITQTSDVWFVALLGEKYANAVEAFNYQVWFTVVLSVDCIFSMLLSSDYRQKLLSITTTIDVAVLVPGLYFGMFEGAKGVALAKLFCAVCCLLYHIIIIGYLFSKQPKIIIKLACIWLYFAVLMTSNVFFRTNTTVNILTITAAVIGCFILVKSPFCELLVLIKRKYT